MRTAGNAVFSACSKMGMVRTLLCEPIQFIASARWALMLSIATMAVSSCNGTARPTDYSSVNTEANVEIDEPMGPYQRSQALTWLGRYEEAEIHAQKALDLAKAEYGPNNPNTALRLRVLARIYQAQQRLTEAESPCEQVLATFETTLRPNDPDIADVLNSLAEVYDAQDRVSDAELFYTRSMAVAENSGRIVSPNLYNNLAVIYGKQDRYAEAEAILKHYISIPEATRESYFTRQSIELMTLFSPSSPYAAEGRSLTDRSISTLKMARADGSFARGHFLLASLYKVQGKYVEAEPAYKRSLAIAENAYGSEHPFVAMVLESYAALLHQTNRNEAAAELETRANEIRAKQQ